MARLTRSIKNPQFSLCPFSYLLKYWSAQAKSENMPILCQLAEIYLGMASASVPVECLFSTAALVANGKRSNLQSYKLEQILFVHDNFNFVKDHMMLS